MLRKLFETASDAQYRVKGVCALGGQEFRMLEQVVCLCVTLLWGI
jgi:hypothetical protein